MSEVLTKEKWEQYKKQGVLKKNASWEKFCKDAEKSRAKFNAMARELEREGISISVKIGDGDYVKL